MSKSFARLMTAVAATALVLTGCGKQLPVATGLERAGSTIRVAGKVPNTFMWGVSTAGYQWEGHDATSQWAKWDADGKTTERNAMAANGLSNYNTDIELTAGLGCNTFRTSIEWSRIEPQKGVIDPAGVKYYHDLLRTMKGNGLTPVITLHHFSHPQWMAAEGGWENAASGEYFQRFAAFVAKEYANDIEYYLTFNEPNVYIAGGWLAGAMPPGKKNPFTAYKVMKNMIRAHKLAFGAIHANDPSAKVSFNWYTAEWALRSVMDVESEEEKAVKSDTFMLDAMTTGNGENGTPNGRTIDYVALDYYCKLSAKNLIGLPRQDQWEVYPVGLYNALKRYHKRYNLPILIAENGMATWDHAPRKDRWTRAAYMVAHVREMQRAMAEGVPVMGYVQWSITDNYEWGSFSPRFGLYRVECRDRNFTRIPTDGVDAMRTVIANGGVTQAIAARYLPGTVGGVNLVVPGAPSNGKPSNNGVSSSF